MSNAGHWIRAGISQARKGDASVTAAVSARIEQLLKGRLMERQLASTELTSIAKVLLADMVPAPPESGAKR